MNKNNLAEKSKCMGCEMCANICPASAIQMTPDENGFLIPNVDGSKCTDCGLCTASCSKLELEAKSGAVPDCYALWAIEELRSQGSSGGAFGVFADYTLENGGRVCGAAFDSDFCGVSHIIVGSKDDLKKIYKSKYVQSKINMVYRDIKKCLESSEKPFVFCGCPCQVDALTAFLEKNYENLITVDLLCHGVSSPKTYKAYIDEIAEKHSSEVTGVDFRNKERGGWGTYVSVDLADGNQFGDDWKGTFFEAYSQGLIFRESCFYCKYAGNSRVGDITLGDFWGIEQYNKEWHDGKGTSLVMCNTDKGKKVFTEIIGRYFSKVEKISYETTLNISRKSNGALFNPVPRPKMRECFLRHINKNDGFYKALQYAKTSLLDVGIVGWWIKTPGSNYGSILTNFALYHYLLSLGLSVIFICPPGVDREKLDPFCKRYYRMSAKHTAEDIDELNLYIDNFIVSSDQLWYYHDFIRYGYLFLLDFVKTEKNKITYATSYGHPQSYFPKNEVIKARYLMKKIDHVSVRELDAVNICKDVFGVNAVQVLDPVFLCDKKIYQNLAKEATHKTEGDYIFAYILDPTDEKKALLKYISEVLNKKVVSITDRQFDRTEKEKILEDFAIITNPTVEDVIYHFMNCNYIVTDSLHGTCFSLLFEKRFITVKNEKRGISRFNTLETIFKISDRLCDDVSEIIGNESIVKNMDYDLINNILKEETRRSSEWLKNAVFTEKRKSNK